VRFLHLLPSTLIALVLLAACSFPDLPGAPQMPKPPSPRSLPGFDDLLDQLPGFDLDLLKELELPDLSEIADLPQLGDIQGLPVPENAIAFAGPTEMRIDVGDFIRGTDIQLTGIVDGRAEFLFSGLRAERIAGDSLDFDGPWPKSPATRSTSMAPGLTSAASTICCVCASIGWRKGTSAPPVFIAL